MSIIYNQYIVGLFLLSWNEFRSNTVVKSNPNIRPFDLNMLKQKRFSCVCLKELYFQAKFHFLNKTEEVNHFKEQETFPTSESDGIKEESCICISYC